MTATLYRWTHLLGDTPRTIVFPQLSLESGRDQELPVVEGRGEVRMATPSRFEYTITGHPTDFGEALKQLRRSNENLYLFS
jgi:hypothetical protein